MLENNIILDSKIKCQNCGFTLALRSGTDETIMVASDIEQFIEEPCKQVKIITLKCKRCGCFLQVKEENC
jgi:hypothetical protein